MNLQRDTQEWHYSESRGYVDQQPEIEAEGPCKWNIRVSSLVNLQVACGGSSISKHCLCLENDEKNTFQLFFTHIHRMMKKNFPGGIMLWYYVYDPWRGGGMVGERIPLTQNMRAKVNLLPMLVYKLSPLLHLAFSHKTGSTMRIRVSSHTV